MVGQKNGARRIFVHRYIFVPLNFVPCELFIEKLNDAFYSRWFQRINGDKSQDTDFFVSIVLLRMVDKMITWKIFIIDTGKKNYRKNAGECIRHSDILNIIPNSLLSDGFASLSSCSYF